MDFHVKVWGDDSKTWWAQLQSECKACQLIRQRVRNGKSEDEARKRRVLVSVAERNERRRARYAERMATDPEFRERVREANRELKAAQRRRDGAEVRGSYKLGQTNGNRLKRKG